MDINGPARRWVGRSVVVVLCCAVRFKASVHTQTHTHTLRVHGVQHTIYLPAPRHCRCVACVYLSRCIKRMCVGAGRRPMLMLYSSIRAFYVVRPCSAVNISHIRLLACRSVWYGLVSTLTHCARVQQHKYAVVATPGKYSTHTHNIRHTRPLCVHTVDTHSHTHGDDTARSNFHMLCPHVCRGGTPARV